MLPTTNDSPVLKFYNRYEHLAEKYASQVYNHERIGFEYEDLLQEFKVKIYTSIIAYAEKWRLYKESGRYKPIAIELYIKSALVNRTKDFIRQINDLPFNVLSVEETKFDYSITYTLDSKTVINKNKCVCEINGVNLFENLTTKQARCFLLYLNGFSIGRLEKIFKSSNFSPRKVINDQIAFLKTKQNTLQENITRKYVNFEYETES